MSAPKKVSEKLTELVYPFETDDAGGKVFNQEKKVERTYADGTKTSDYYTDYTVEKPGGGSYTWHASLHSSGRQNLDLVTAKGTFHQHDCLGGEQKRYKHSFWQKNDEK